MTQFAKRMDGITGSAIRELFKLLDKGDIISFGGGNPSADSFPVADVRKIADELLDTQGAMILQYAATSGYVPLRQGLIDTLYKRAGVTAAIDEVLPVSGSMQGVDLLCKIYLDRGDAVIVEAPTFLGTLQTLRIYGANIIGAPSDDEGVDTDELEKLFKLHKPKFFYCIPTFQNPSGKTLGVERRKKIAELADKYDVMILEDDPYRDLRYSGEALPAIKTFDKSGHVIMLNSVSKLISPGIRVGAVLASPEIIGKLIIAKQGADTHSPTLNQAIVAEFLLRGMLDAQLEKIKSLYAGRLELMLKLLDDELDGYVKHTTPEGGLFVWCEVLEKASRRDMLDTLTYCTKEKKVAYVPGQHFFVDPKGHENTFRLNFTGAKFEDIEVGMKKLAQAIR